jgi:hypothetical protein
MPQVLPVLQEDAAAPREKEFPPEILEAKEEIFFLICGLPQAGQFTSWIALALRSSSSNGSPQSVHTNSNIGMQMLLYVKVKRSHRGV